MKPSDDDVPEPAASPRPPELVGESVTGVYPASRDFVREVNRVGLWKTTWAIFVTATAIITATLWAYRAAAAEARDAGVEAAADVRRQAESTQRELERFQKEVTARLDRSDASQGRTELKVDKLLERLNVPNPAPSPDKDAGR